MRYVSSAALKSLVPPSLRVAKGALEGWYGGEPELRILRHVCSGDGISIDVGANRGVYAWHFRRLGQQVVAFEPQPAMADLLRRAFGPSVRIEEVALSDGQGTARLRVPVDHMQSGRATIESSNPLDGEAMEIDVPMRRLDDYSFERVSLVKIDVEGHELAVLKGAEALLRRDLPTLIVEAEERHRDGAVESIANHLESRGYRGFFLRAGQLHDLDELSSQSGLGREAAAQNLYNFIFAARPDAIGRLVQLTPRARAA